jgi:signal transduction histidine kinase/ligand-binding sensor domain-containing protein
MRRAVIALGILLAWGSGAYASDPALDVSQYAHTAWKIREGFAAGTIHQIAQTPDGYLWLATESGLLRFDGVRAVPWQPPQGEHLPNSDIRSLIAARDGTLWIGTAKGLVSWKDGKLVEYPDLAGRDIYTVYEDPQGVLWASGIQWEIASSLAKLCAIKGRDVQCYGGDGKLGFGVFSIYEDSRGNLWLAAANGLWRWKPGTPQHYDLPAALQAGTSFFNFSRNAICEDEGGTLLIAADRGFGKLINGKLEVEPHPAGMTLRATATLLRGRDGSLWIGTLDAGILHQRRGKTDAFTESEGLSGNSVETFFEDLEGNIWAATENGIDRFREYAVPTISVRQGLSSPFVVCVLAGRDGSVWMGTSEGLDRWKDGQITVYRRPGKQMPRQNNPFSNAVVREIPLQDDYVDSLYQDPQDRIWVSTHNGLGYFQNERFVPLTDVPITAAIPVTGDDAGNIWTASNSCGLCRLRDGKVVERFSWADLRLPKSGSNSIVVDPAHGGLWLASWSSGVAYFKDGLIRAHWGPAQGLGSGRVTDLKLDADGSFWAATEGGLSRIKDGRVVTLTSQNGLPCDSVHDFAEDNTHTLWLYTACGLVRLPRAELDAWITDPGHTVQTTVFDSSDGVRSHAGDYYPSPRVARTADGRLWFLPLDGVSIVDPRRLPLTNKLPPPVHIEQITADRKTYWQNWSGDATFSHLKLPPLVHDLTIDYTALSLVVPDKVHFRFKLEGQDENWREVVNVRQVQYSNLGPGKYTFRVIACNNSGVWNEVGDTLNFSIAPAYWQTNWFRAACVAAMVALLWWIYRLRVSVLEGRQRILERHQGLLERHQGEVHALNERLMKAQEEERIRIAGELHDGVLQRITSLSLRLGTATLELPPDSEPRTEVREVEKELIEVGSEIRQLSHELHPAVLQEAGPTEALSSYCEEFSKLRGIPVSYQADKQVDELSPRAALCIYRIAQEALGNVAKHAKAKQVQVRLTRSDSRVCLVVSDDGVGFNPDGSGKSGGLGLINMRERVRQLNGTFEFESAPGRGTTVKAEVPFRAAS